ncbi:MAG: hypothetical protein IJ634_07915 [Bacteroidales bacterium]|nr:hypothetical protein [Bacteroidales bacterium]
MDITTQIVLNVNDVSLLPSLKQILGAIKGVTIDRMVATDEAEDAQMRFITETITTGYQEATEGKFAGKNLATLDDLIAELRAEA